MGAARVRAAPLWRLGVRLRRRQLPRRGRGARPRRAHQPSGHGAGTGRGRAGPVDRRRRRRGGGGRGAGRGRSKAAHVRPHARGEWPGPRDGERAARPGAGGRTGGPAARPRAAGLGVPGRPASPGGCFRGERRPRQEVRARARGVGEERCPQVAHPPDQGHSRRPWAGRQGRVPLPRAGLAVREHAGRRSRSHRARDVRRSRPDHGADPRPYAHELRLPGRGRRGGHGGGGGGAQGHDHLPARDGRHRHRHHAPARQARGGPGRRHGAQPRGVGGRGRCAHARLLRGVGRGQCPRPRHGVGVDRRQGQDGLGARADRRDRALLAGDRRLPDARQHEQQEADGHRGRQRRGRSGGRLLQPAWHDRADHPRVARLPQQGGGAGRGCPLPHHLRDEAGLPPHSPGRQHRRPALPDGRHGDHPPPPGRPDGVIGPVRARHRDLLSRGRAHLPRGRPEASLAGLGREHPRGQARRPLSFHQPPEARWRTLVP